MKEIYRSVLKTDTKQPNNHHQNVRQKPGQKVHKKMNPKTKLTALALSAMLPLFIQQGALAKEAVTKTANEKAQKEKIIAQAQNPQAESESTNAIPVGHIDRHDKEEKSEIWIQTEGAVITASRIDTKRTKTPSVVQVIGEKEINRSVSHNADDLLVEAGLGHVHKNPGVLSTLIGVRGAFTGSTPWESNVLILVNGRLSANVNPAIYSNALIEKIEIVKGPSSVVYGSGASGGVINIITKAPESEGLSGSLTTTAGSWGYQQNSLDLAGSFGDMFFSFSGDYETGNSYETPEDGLIKNTETNSISSALVLGYRLGQDHTVSFTLDGANYWDIGSPGARGAYASENDFAQIQHAGGAVDYRRNGLQASAFAGFDKRGNFARQDSPSDTYVDDYITTWKSWGGSFQNLFTYQDQGLLVGAETSSIGLTTDTKTSALYPNANSVETGVFSEFQLHFQDRVYLNLGARFDQYKSELQPTENYKIDQNQDYVYSQVSYRGGAVYKITPAFRLRANAGTGFRAPAPNERSVYTNEAWGNIYQGNPDLTVERSQGVDAGLDYQGKTISGALSWFATEYTDKIKWQKTYDFVTWQTIHKPVNLEGASIRGLEGELAWMFLEINSLGVNMLVHGNATYYLRRQILDQENIDAYGTDVIWYMPEMAGTGGLSIGSRAFDLHLMGTYTGSEKYQDWSTFPETIKDKDPFWVYSAKALYRFNEAIEAQASVDNILDEQYSYVDGYPMPGRNFSFGVKYKFL